MLLLSGVVKHYAWGKSKDDGYVGKLASNASPDDTSTEPFAELWMGTHNSGESIVKETKEPLSKYLSTNFKYSELPFLLKVLSFSKPLSIQVHPNKDKAIELHKKQPTIYKDANHKPEMLIALNDTIVMVSFRPYGEIEGFMKKIEPFGKLMSVECRKKFSESIQNKKNEEESLRGCFNEYMKFDGDKKDVINSLMIIAKKNEKNFLYKTILFIHKHFPDDLGVFAPFFLNTIQLKSGEAVFLGANEIHAYIEGDGVECMACSDNVVRAGLTPKLKDMETLLSIISCKSRTVDNCLLKGKELVKNDEVHLTRYDPPIKEFTVERIKLNGTFILNTTQVSILVVVDGNGEMEENKRKIKYGKGSIIFLEQNIEAKIHGNNSLLFRAF
ncbi:hypothetical protein SNEBB_010367 [Seison nebaliae]|nr:hypothetical protein SNEBB_010367 [Seison nebaliae]